MTYHELVNKVQEYSGFSNQESEQSLKLMIETLSSRLQEGERQKFASQLPSELQDVALAPTDTDRFNATDMYHQLAELENTDENHVKQQLTAVWQALKDALNPGLIENMRAQLPNDLVADLR